MASLLAAIRDRRTTLSLTLGLVALAMGACTRPNETTPTAPPQQVQSSQPPTTGPAAPPATKVALLLPLSGRASTIGKDLQDAAQMALFDAQADVELVTKDTGDSQSQAITAATAAIDEGAKLILGPLFSQSAKAIAPVAAARGVNVIAFSNDASAARPGLFILGFRPEEQVDRVVRYARQQGLSRVALLAPDDAYGNLAVQAFRRTMAALDPAGGSSRAIVYPAEGDASDAIRSAVSGQQPYDAVLIADGGNRLIQAATLVRGTGDSASTVRILGTRRFEEDGATLSEAPVQGAWVAGVAPDAAQGFRSRFESTYGRTPGELAVLGYDAVGLAALLARSDTSFPAALITDSQGFVGALSPFRLMPDGTAQHSLAILQVDQGRLDVIEPAPQSFGGSALTN